MELYYRYQHVNYYPEEDPFSITPVLENKYVPTYAIQNQRTFAKNPGSFYYTKPLIYIGNLRRKTNTLKNIIGCFDGNHPMESLIKIGTQSYFIMFNAIFTDRGEPLAMLVFRQKDFLNPEIVAQFKSGVPDYSKLVLLYASELLTEKKYGPLGRKLQPELLTNTCFIKGIEVNLMPSAQIEKNTFARVFEMKKTKTLTGLQDYLNTTLSRVFCPREEDSFEEKLNIREVVLEIPPVIPSPQSFVPPTEELSIEEEALFYSDEESTHIDLENYSDEEEPLNLEDFSESVGASPVYFDSDFSLIENIDIGATDIVEDSPPVIWRNARRAGSLIIELLDE